MNQFFKHLQMTMLASSLHFVSKLISISAIFILSFLLFGDKLDNFKIFDSRNNPQAKLDPLTRGIVAENFNSPFSQIKAKANTDNCNKIYFLDNNFATTPNPNINSKIIEYDPATNTVISNTREIQSTRTFALALAPDGNRLFYYDRNDGRIEYQTLDDSVTHTTSATQIGNTATVNRMSIDFGGMGYILTGTTLYSFNSNDPDSQMAMTNLGNLNDKAGNIVSVNTVNSGDIVIRGNKGYLIDNNNNFFSFYVNSFTDQLGNTSPARETTYLGKLSIDNAITGITLNKTSEGQIAFFTGGEKKYSVVNSNGLGSTNLGVLDPNLGYITDSASCYYPNIDPIITRPTKTWSNLTNPNSSLSSNTTITGDTIQYKIKLSNTGVTPSTNSQIIDQLPLGVEYQLGTTKINGAIISDNPQTLSDPLTSGINSAFPLSNWYDLTSPNQPVGTIFPDTTPNILDNEIEITFQVKVTATADNTIISNIAQFRSAQTPLTTSQNGEGDPTDILVNFVAPPVSSVVSSVGESLVVSKSPTSSSSSVANPQNQDFDPLKGVSSSSSFVVESLAVPSNNTSAQTPPCQTENYTAKEKYTYKVKVGKGKRAKFVTKTGTRNVVKQRCKTSKPASKPIVAKKKKGIVKKALKPKLCRGVPCASTKKALKKPVTRRSGNAPVSKKNAPKKKKAKTPRKKKVAKPSRKKGVRGKRVVKNPLTKKQKNAKINKKPSKKPKASKIVAKPKVCTNKKGKVIKCPIVQKPQSKSKTGLEIPKITPKLRVGNNLSILYDRVKSLIGNAFNNFKNSFGKAQTEEQQINSKAQRASDQLSDFVSGVRRDIEKCTLGNFFENTNCAINSESFKTALGTLGNILVNFLGGFMEGALEAFSWQNLLTTLVTALITGGTGIIFQAIGGMLGIVGVASNLTGIVQGVEAFANADIFTKFKTIGKIAGTVSVGAVLGGLANNLAGSISKIASSLRKVKVPPKVMAPKPIPKPKLGFCQIGQNETKWWLGEISVSALDCSLFSKLVSHYNKHVTKQKEFGDITIEQYFVKALLLLKQAKTKTNNIYEFYSPSKKTFNKLNMDTGEYISYNPNGTINTFFKPDNPIEYWLTLLDAN